MKAIDLMIGDWVECIYYDEEGEEKSFYAKISAIDNDSTLLDGTKKFLVENSEVEDIDFIKYIPLTTEILELNGFKKFESKNYALCYFIKGLTLQWNCYGKYFYIRSDDADIRITEVHELQHALRLCGLGELANNFKI